MDRFKSFKALCRFAAEGRDFSVEFRKGHSGFAVMAPHGGGIEPGTDIIAAAVAGNEHAYYAFKGIGPRNNAQLHIASERFDEPRALALIRQVHTVVTLHGCRGRQAAVYVGGLATDLIRGVVEALRKAGFEAGGSPVESLRGIHRFNLCNRGRRGKGVQLELTGQLRRELMGRAAVNHQPSGNDRFRAFVGAVRRVLADSGLIL